MASIIEQVLIRELRTFAHDCQDGIRKMKEEIGLHRRQDVQPPTVKGGHDFEYEERQVKKARLETQQAQLEAHRSWALHILDSVMPDIRTLGPQMRLAHEGKRCICGTTPRFSCCAHRPFLSLDVEKRGVN